jgi:hypothetical protein
MHNSAQPAQLDSRRARYHPGIILALENVVGLINRNEVAAWDDF